MTPLQQYQQQLASGNLLPDDIQANTMQCLQHIYEQLVHKNSVLKNIVSRLQHGTSRQKFVIKGAYLWGGVGIGKTCMMDIFYESLPFSKKLRMHFHSFMQMVHAQLAKLQGHKDPLKAIASDLAKQTRVLCFDEFFVSDIADAMLLGGLLTALLAKGVTLVATSNCAPENLYRNGLQRERFLSVIHLLQNNTTVIHLETQKDYRLRHFQKMGSYFSPLNTQAAAQLSCMYQKITRIDNMVPDHIMINDRPIAYLAKSGDTIWFDFNSLCQVPRSQLDYLVIAKQFQTVLLSNVPQITADQHNLITYFVNLVDVFYDSHVKLVLSAAVPLDKLYPAGRLAFEFQRTKSRLQEMQSEEYWHHQHHLNGG